MSCFVTRPAMPVPVSRRRSTPCSFAIRRTSGEVRWRGPSSALRRSSAAGGARARLAAGRPRAPVRPGASTAMPSACGVAARSWRPAAAPPRPWRRVWALPQRPRPAAPIVATTLLTATVSPSLTVISSSVPAAGDGISASTLSVEISNSGSSRSTLSPTFLIQRTMVPSAIDSPIWGITTGVDMTPRSGSQVRWFELRRRRGRTAEPLQAQSANSRTSNCSDSERHPLREPLSLWLPRRGDTFRCVSPRRAPRAPPRPPPPTSSDARGWS